MSQAPAQSLTEDGVYAQDWRAGPRTPARAIAHTCACDQHTRAGKAITSPIAGTVLASNSFSLVLAPRKPGTCQVRSEQPAGGQAADSFRGAFERGVGIAAADP